MKRFFDELSPEARRRRFLAPTTASEGLLTLLCDNRDPHKSLTLIAVRRNDQGTHIIGVGSYFADSDTTAEVAFAVDDKFHGRGIATALLERLAQFGRDQNFERFSASVLPENYAMLDVFRDSGFEIHSTADAGTVEVVLSLQSSTASIAAADERERQATIASLRSILKPRAVAVIGASRRESNLGRRVLESLLGSGFLGPIYPVNPAVSELHGGRCYSTARDLPEGVDLAVIAVPRESVLAAVDDCAIPSQSFTIRTANSNARSQMIEWVGSTWVWCSSYCRTAYQVRHVCWCGMPRRLRRASRRPITSQR